MSGRALAWGSATLAVALLLGALAWGLVHPANPGSSLLGRIAPDIAVQELDGGVTRLSDLRGRPVVLNFWASWCATCQAESEALRQAAEAHGTRVAFLGVDFKDTPVAARAFQERNRLPYPVGPPANGIPSAYGPVQPPLTYFIDRNGVAVVRFDGPLTATLIERYLQLAGVRTGGPSPLRGG
jgi:cytochrome c biogenesis protein CcmG, thiol:disulfide interchange protein DsbE